LAISKPFSKILKNLTSCGFVFGVGSSPRYYDNLSYSLSVFLMLTYGNDWPEMHPDDGGPMKRDISTGSRGRFQDGWLRVSLTSRSQYLSLKPTKIRTGDAGVRDVGDRRPRNNGNIVSPLNSAYRSQKVVDPVVEGRVAEDHKDEYVALYGGRGHTWCRQPLWPSARCGRQLRRRTAKRTLG
jgi:hypothetical protein